MVLNTSIIGSHPTELLKKKFWEQSQVPLNTKQPAQLIL